VRGGRILGPLISNAQPVLLILPEGEESGKAGFEVSRGERKPPRRKKEEVLLTKEEISSSSIFPDVK